MFKMVKHPGKSQASSLCEMVVKRVGCKSAVFVSGNTPRIFRSTAIAFLLTLPAACGGGNGGGVAGLEPLPTPLVADASAARDYVEGTAPTTTLTSAQIQQEFRSIASGADTTLIASDVYLTTPGIQGADTSVNCSAGSCGDIAIGDVTFTISLDNIGTNMGNRFELTRVNSEYSLVMLDREVITLAQHRAAGRDNDNDVFEYLSYGGWLENSAFSVNMLTIDPGSNESSLLFGVSYGDPTGSRPTGTGIAAWHGPVVGVHKSNGDAIQGQVVISSRDISRHQIGIALINLQNLTSGAELTAMRWPKISISANGTFSSTTDGDINGAFYGTGHREAGGTFNRKDIIGAFGATRR